MWEIPAESFTDMRTSPDRNFFNATFFVDEEDRDSTDALTPVVDQLNAEEDLRKSDVEWRTNNLEYDLRTSDLIATKCKRHDYSQNLYAALCNNEFQKLDLVQVLTDKKWSCSWRAAGGIVANIREKGDYLDWYCSGMSGVPMDLVPSSFAEYLKHDSEVKTLLMTQHLYVPESVVTPEIREDLKNLGWVVATSDD